MVPPAEKCFDKTRYEYLEVGDRWARVRQGQVEQCTCAGGHVQCEDTRHTGTLWLGGQVKSLPPGVPCPVLSQGHPHASCMRPEA